MTTTLFGWDDPESTHSNGSQSTILPITTKGDLITRNATHNTNLAVGTNNQILTADSATATGLNWKSSVNVNDVTTNSLKVSSTLDNTKTKILVQDNDGQIYHRDNIVDTDTAQTLTNKTIDSASNTIKVNSTDINSLVGQDVRSSADVMFNGITSTNTLFDNLETTNMVFTGSQSMPSEDNFLVLKSSDKSVGHRTDVVTTAASQTLTGKTLAAESNTITVGGNNITTLFTDSPTFAQITTTHATDPDITMGGTVKNRKLVMYPGPGNDHQFYGMGVNGGVLRFQVDSSASDFVFYAGVNGTTSNEVFRVKGSRGVQFPNTTGGYIPTTLNYYEEYIVSFSTWSGAINSSGSGAMTLTRIGNKVTLQLADIGGSFVSSTRIYAPAVIPERFRPDFHTFAPIIVINNGAPQSAFGHLIVRPDGTVDIYNSGGTSFTGPGVAGTPYAQCVSYLL